jgi:ABC-type glycerol-3-phosphate transport system substrate-binding protein
MYIKKLFPILVLVAMVLAACTPAATPAPTEPVMPATAVPPTAVPPTPTSPPIVLHFMYYQDAVEASIMAPLVTKFQLANPGILVELDVVPYANITNQLPAQVQAGQAPDPLPQRSVLHDE